MNTPDGDIQHTAQPDTLIALMHRLAQLTGQALSGSVAAQTASVEAVCGQLLRHLVGSCAASYGLVLLSQPNEQSERSQRAGKASQYAPHFEHEVTAVDAPAGRVGAGDTATGICATRTPAAREAPGVLPAHPRVLAQYNLTAQARRTLLTLLMHTTADVDLTTAIHRPTPPLPSSSAIIGTSHTAWTTDQWHHVSIPLLAGMTNSPKCILALGWSGENVKAEAMVPTIQQASALLADVQDLVAAVIAAALQRERLQTLEARVAHEHQLLREREAACAEARAEWEDIFDAISDPIGVLTTEYRIVRANAAYRALCDLTGESPLPQGHPCFTSSAGAAEPCAGCPLPDTMRTRRPHVVQHEAVVTRASDGVSEQRIYQRWTYPILSTAGTVERVVEMVKDVTEQEQLRRAESEQRIQHEADQLKAALLGTVSHELRSPLTTIKGYAETLLRHERRLPRAERHEFLQTISAASDRMEVLINRMLELSQLEAGTLSIQSSPVNALQLVHEAVQAVEQRIHEQQAGIPRVRFVLPDGQEPVQTGQLRVDNRMLAPLLVTGDPRLLRAVLDHLLDNAVKYTPSDRGLIEVGLYATETGLGDSQHQRQHQHQHQPMVEIVVRDNGIGIAPEQLNHIFDQFHRVDTRLTREVNGLGIGLALCKRIAELHGGMIWAESNPGAGSSFHLLLPQFWPNSELAAEMVNEMMNTQVERESADATEVTDATAAPVEEE